jgi:hypothetical protein
MGYACPVCETPQSDAGHLANHLAITAIARGGDHEAWLDDHVPDWDDLDEAALAERVVDFADEADYPRVFEDTTGRQRGPDHDHAHDASGHGHGDTRQSPDDLPVDLDASFLDADEVDDADAADVLEQARELTRERRDDSETE